MQWQRINDKAFLANFRRFDLGDQVIVESKDGGYYCGKLIKIKYPLEITVTDHLGVAVVLTDTEIQRITYIPF